MTPVYFRALDAGHWIGIAVVVTLLCVFLWMASRDEGGAR